MVTLLFPGSCCLKNSHFRNISLCVDTLSQSGQPYLQKVRPYLFRNRKNEIRLTGRAKSDWHQSIRLAMCVCMAISIQTKWEGFGTFAIKNLQEMVSCYCGRDVWTFLTMQLLQPMGGSAGKTSRLMLQRFWLYFAAFIAVVHRSIYAKVFIPGAQALKQLTVC